MQRYTARNSFSGVLGYIFSKIFGHLAADGPKFFRNFGRQKGKGLKVPDTHPYPRLYRSPPPRENSLSPLKAKINLKTSLK